MSNIYVACININCIRLLGPGQLRVMYPDSSPADNITVRVQADVNGENFVARDYVSDGGIINFDVPALPTLAQSVWLEVYTGSGDYSKGG